MTPAKLFGRRESVHLAKRVLAQGAVVGPISLTNVRGLGESNTQRAIPIADFLVRQHLFLPVGETLLQVGRALRQRSAQTTKRVTPQVTPHVAPQVTGEANGEVRRLLAVMGGELKRAEIQQALGLPYEDHVRDAYLGPALEAGVIEITVPEKPRSRKHRYRVTERGRALLQVKNI